MKKASQAELAKLFGKTQSWVSKRQTRRRQPMPRDLEGAIAWGRRQGLLPAGDSDQVLPFVLGPEFNPSAADERSTIEEADIELKQARARKLKLELETLTGEMLSREDVERREIVVAAEFRRIACEFPLRVLGVVARHVVEPGVVAAIESDMRPLASELLNATDPHSVLAGTREEIAAAIHAYVETVLLKDWPKKIANVPPPPSPRQKDKSV